MSFSRNDIKFREHQRIHLNNPHINYIHTENCIYCKLDRREAFGNCFSSPRTLSNKNQTNIDYRNIKRIPREVFNNTNNIISNSNNYNTNYMSNFTNTRRRNFRELNDYSRQIQSIRNRISELNTYINNVHNNSSRIRNMFNLSGNRLSISYQNNSFEEFDDDEEEEDDDEEIVYGFPDDNLNSNNTRNNRNNNSLRLVNSNSELQVYRGLNRERCSICYNNIKYGDIVRKLTCNHLFHQNCVDTWLEDKSTCPLCRYNFV